MATRQKLTEEFLTCIICHEVFKDPVTLHCGHTLCNQCVTAFTKTQTQAIGEKSIPCPHCRALTKVPDPTKPVDEWAGQFHTGFFVKGLVDAVVTDEKDCDQCVPCHEEGETIPAVFWCSDCGHGLCTVCERVHRKMPITKDHEVISFSQDNRHSVKKSKKRFICSKHPDAVIDMMCEDHDVAMYHRCCTLYHRKCDSVITLEECLPKLRSVIEAHGKELETVVEEATKELSVRKSQVKEVEKEAEKALTLVESSCKKIIAEVLKQERHLKENVKQNKDEALQQLQADIKSCEMSLEAAHQKKGLMREAIASNIPMNFYEMYKMCTPSTCKQAYNSDTHESKIHIRLDDNSSNIVSHIRDKSIAVLSLGDQQSPTANVSTPTDTSLHTLSVSEHSTELTCSKVSPHDIKDRSLSIGTESTATLVLVNKIETGLTNVWDVLVLTVLGIKTVVMTTPTDQRVVSIYQQRDKQCKSQLNLNSYTYNMTQISADKCAVTVPVSKQIVFITVTPDLKRDKTITTSKEYRGLTCLNSSTLAASTTYPGVVDILDMSGSILRSFGSGVFSAPRYLSCTSDNIILVSDCSNDSLTGITDTGVTKFQYPQKGDKTIHGPHGVCHSGCGEIFVSSSWSNRVVQLTDTGKFVREVLSSADGLSSPRGVCVDNDNMMYVIVNKTTIHVYEFK